MPFRYFLLFTKPCENYIYPHSHYLAQKAQEAGYHPEIILAGRRMNDSMGGYVASEVMHEYGITTMTLNPTLPIQI
jgi:UDP-N-acetyl-D-mannosaminuronate dehydrogenase